VERIPIWKFLQNPREILGMTLLIPGTLVSLCHVVGNYSQIYVTLQLLIISSGAILAIVDLISSLPPYKVLPTESVSPNIRMGIVDDALLNIYSGIYTGCVSWLALRTSLFYPVEWTRLDAFIGPMALLIFLFSILCPVLTLIHHSTGAFSIPLQYLVAYARGMNNDVLDSVPIPPLSETELLRARGLLAIGIIACIYAPEVLAFLFLGQDWWNRVIDHFPSQPILESSTATFGILATQASMMSHRAGKAGVAPFTQIVPAFAFLCFLLAILPCGAALFWLYDEISFLEFYNV
jgi:hypothetical protein